LNYPIQIFRKRKNLQFFIVKIELPQFQIAHDDSKGMAESHDSHNLLVQAPGFTFLQSFLLLHMSLEFALVGVVVVVVVVVVGDIIIFTVRMANEFRFAADYQLAHIQIVQKWPISLGDRIQPLGETDVMFVLLSR
jgi:hypothetical protein